MMKLGKLIKGILKALEPDESITIELTKEEFLVLEKFLDKEYKENFKEFLTPAEDLQSNNKFGSNLIKLAMPYNKIIYFVYYIRGITK